MSTLSISCFAILLKRSLQLHHPVLSRPNGRLLPELERCLTLLGNDFEIPLSSQAARELREQNAEKVSLQITLPPLSPSPQPAATLVVTGMLAGNRPGGTRFAIMPCAIRLDSGLQPWTLLQWLQILEHLARPENLSAEFVRPSAPPSKPRVVIRHYPSINVRVSAPRVA